MDSRPLPKIDSISRPLFDAATRRKLELPRCLRCNSFFFPPRPSCPKCFSHEIAWAPASGKGTVVSLTRVFITPFADYVKEYPYALAVVKLAEGPQFMSNIVNCDVNAVEIGTSVKVSFEERAGGVFIPQFEPA